MKGKTKNKQLIIALALFFFLSLPFLAKAEDQCCVCTPKKNPEAPKEAVGAPLNGSCATYEAQKNAVCNVFSLACDSPELKKALEANNEDLQPISPPVMEMPIPGLTFSSQVPSLTEAGNDYYLIPWIAEYIGAVYKFGVAAASILAMMMIIIGGFIWLTAGGSQEKVTTAKGYITGALMGLVLALGSYTILKMVNPALVHLKPLKIMMVKYEDLEILPLAETSEAIAMGILDPSQLDATYGTCTGSMCGAAGTVKLTSVKWPAISGGQVLVNAKVAASMQTIANTITTASLGGYKLINGGTMCCRANVNNPKKKSLHSYGIAIDFNPATNPNYKKKGNPGPCKTDLPMTVINTMKANGWAWGGDFSSVCDAMHFEYRGN